KFDNDGYFQIHDFSFTGIAALGTNIEPCFKKAEIQLYTTNEFRNDIKTLMSELNSFSLKEGGNKEMIKETEPVTPVVPASPERTILDMFTEAQFTEAHEMNAVFGI